MIYTGTGILTQGGFGLTQKIKTLSFEVAGDQFPFDTYPPNDDISYFGFRSNGSNSVTVNYADGTVQTFSFVQASGSDYRIYWKANNDQTGYNVGRHIYQDANTGNRIISFTFDRPERIYDQDSYWVQLKGSYPEEAVYFPNLEGIKVQSAKAIENFPNQLGGGLKRIVLQEGMLVKSNKIPVAFFGNPIEVFNIYGAFNLGNIEQSNFFLIYRFKETLDTLYISDCDLIELPEELTECLLIDYFHGVKNKFQRLPEQLEELVNLETLHLGNQNLPLADNSMLDFSQLVNLRTLSLQFDNLDFSEIPVKWSGLKSLNLLASFQSFCINDARLNEFIPYIYQLVIENGFVDPTSPEAIASGYPYQHRAWTWGHASLNVDSTIEPPPNFTPGVFNGNAQTNGQRVYELGANYAHLIN